MIQNTFNFFIIYETQSGDWSNVKIKIFDITYFKDFNDIFKYEQINNEGKILKISVFHI